MFNPKRFRWIVLIAVVVALLGGGAILFPVGNASSAAGAKPGAAPMIPANFTELARQASPAVVNIRTVQTVNGAGDAFRHFFGGPQQQQPGQPGQPQTPFDEFFERFFGDQAPREFKQRSLGSGFILNKDGYIVTNNHVIQNAEEIQVKLKNGKEYDAKLIGSDPYTDIALIKIESEEDLPRLDIGDSKELDIGQWVVAIGNPFGLEHTVTAGIVSAKGRVIGAGPYDDFIQTDASINPGNSGGPLINMAGEVVGINTAIVAGGAGIGFAIPSAMASDIITQLMKTGEVTRGWIGVGIQDLTADLKDYYNVSGGVLITQVFPGEPAAKAGIQPNDVIVSVNGKNVNAPRELSQMIAGIEPGKKVRLEIVRGGKEKTVNVTITQRQEEEAVTGMPQQEAPPPEVKDALGLETTNITEEIARQYELESTRGVIITGVEPGSKGFEAGFTQGDIIREINHKPVGSVEDYRKIVNGAKAGETLYFYVMRPYQGIQIIKVTK